MQDDNAATWLCRVSPQIGGTVVQKERLGEFTRRAVPPYAGLPTDGHCQPVTFE